MNKQGTDMGWHSQASLRADTLALSEPLKQSGLYSVTLALTDGEYMGLSKDNGDEVKIHDLF